MVPELRSFLNKKCVCMQTHLDAAISLPHAVSPLNAFLGLLKVRLELIVSVGGRQQRVATPDSVCCWRQRERLARFCIRPNRSYVYVDCAWLKYISCSFLCRIFLFKTSLFPFVWFMTCTMYIYVIHVYMYTTRHLVYIRTHLHGGLMHIIDEYCMQVCPCDTRLVL